MAQYNRYNAYDFDRFEARAAATGSAAPAYKPKTQKKPPIRLVEKPKQTAAQTRRQAREAGVRAARIFFASIAILGCMAAVIYSRVQVDELTRDISRMETSIANAQSDAVKLNMTLDSMISIDKVEEIAVNKLGMVKVQDYQVKYIDRSSQDKIVKADSKIIEDNAVINSSAD